MKKYRLWSILLFWFGFLLTFVLIHLLIILNGSVFQYTDWTILLLFIPPFVFWTASCYYDDLYRKQFVEMIKGKTSYYTSNRGNNNLCIFTSKKDAFGAMIDNKGRIIQRSSLLLEESEEIIEEFADKKITVINIIRNQNSKCIKVGRLERERKQEIKQNINNDKLGIEKLKYIFYDYFEEEENNDKIIKQKILKELNKPWNKKLNNMYNTIKLISKIKN